MIYVNQWICINSNIFQFQDSTKGFFALVESLLDDIFKVGLLVSRIASHKNQENYLAEMEDIMELSDAREEFLNRVSTATTQVKWDIYAYMYIIASPRK